MLYFCWATIMNLVRDEWDGWVIPLRLSRLLEHLWCQKENKTQCQVCKGLTGQIVPLSLLCFDFAIIWSGLDIMKS